MGEAFSAHGGRLQMSTKYWLESLKGRNRSEDLGVDGRRKIKCILGKYSWRVWIGFMWLRIGTTDGLL
jgi:hypothetical protein